MSRAIESPFLDEGLFGGGSAPDWTTRMAALASESPFRDAFLPEGEPGSLEADAIASSVEEAQDKDSYEIDRELDEEKTEPASEAGDTEGFVPEVSQADLRTRIDRYFELANTEYTLPGGTKVRARSQFRYVRTSDVDAAKASLVRTLGPSFEKEHPGAIHYAVYGRAKPTQIATITQALIDVGALDAVRNRHPRMTSAQLIRRLQREVRIGIDCAGYVQLAFVYAFLGSDDDSKKTRRSLGLHERRGYERLANLPTSHFLKLKSVTDAQTGDLLVLKPREGDADRAWHTVIIVDRTVAGGEHTLVGDASWGVDLYGENAGGIGRRRLVHDTATGEWWDIDPITGAEAHRNRVGPYNKHRFHGVFRARAAKPASEIETLLEEAETNTDCSASGFGIIGRDDRRRVVDPLEVPCRWICHLWVRRKDSDGKVTHTGGTGVLISPRHVLTVAHLVCEAVKKDGRWITWDATDIRATPARDGDDRPLGTYDVKMPVTVARLWNPKGKPAGFDYALLTLEKPIGDEIFRRLGGKKLCYWGSRACGGGTTVRPLPPGRLEGRTAITAGYPKDKGGTAPHITTGELSNVSAGSQIMHISADACRGQSGSPVWINSGGEHCMVGMMLSVRETTNVALRVTDEICAQLRAWIKGASDICAPRAAASAREEEHEAADTGTLDSDAVEVEVEVEETADIEAELEEEYPEGELIALGPAATAEEDILDDDGLAEALVEAEEPEVDPRLAPEPEAMEQAFGRSTRQSPEEDEAQAPAASPPTGCFTVSAASVVPSIGFEFDLSYGASTVAPPLNRAAVPDDWNRSVYALEGKTLTTHRRDVHGFRLEGDGNRMELATRPFELTDAGLADMESVMARVMAFVDRLNADCVGARPDRSLGYPAKIGVPRWFTPSDLAPGVACVFPLGFDARVQPYYRDNCSVAASPQATLTLPLARIDELVNRIRTSERLKVPGRSWSGPSTDRQGDRSQALYDAQTAVNASRKTHLGKTKLRDGTLVSEANYSATLQGLLILLVSYLRSGELKYSSRDWEEFAKGYLPLNVKNPFRLLYADLTPTEKQVFRELYTGPRTKLWSLAKRGATLNDGATALFPAASHGHQGRYFASLPTWNDLVDHMLANHPHLRTGDGPVCKSKERKGCEVLIAPCSKIIPYETGSRRVTVEMRRIGFNWVFAHSGTHAGVRQPGWVGMTRLLFDLARELNQ